MRDIYTIYDDVYNGAERPCTALLTFMEDKCIAPIAKPDIGTEAYRSVLDQGTDFRVAVMMTCREFIEHEQHTS